MIKATFDSNVWLSGIFWVGEAVKLINLAESGKIDVFVSKEILIEIAEVLQTEKKFQLILKERKEKIKDAIEKVIEISKMVQIKKRVDVVKDDPDDNKIIECAVNSESSFLLTYDNHLLKIAEYKGVKIMHPSDFLKLQRA